MKSCVLYMTFLCVLACASLKGQSRRLDTVAAPQRDKNLPALNQGTLQKLARVHQQDYRQSHRRALRLARQNHWSVRTVYANGRVTALQRLDSRGRPVYYTTYTSETALTTRTDQLWQGGTLGLQLSGANTALAGKLGIWDGGAPRRTHRELTGRVTQQDDGNASGGDNDHATHVAGIMVSTGVNARARGMAYRSTLKAWEWDNDLSEISGAAAGGMLLSNHSYGLGNIGWVYNDARPGSMKWEWHGDTTVSRFEDYRFGYYDEDAQQLDKMTSNAPHYLPVVASGNERGNSGPVSGTSYYLGNSNRTSTLARRAQNEYDLISSYGVAKNVLTVGAVSPLTGGYWPAAIKSAAFSAWGPTDDGRIKPDLVGDGVNVFSAIATSDQAYTSYSGTSMAAPNVTGSLFLLQEHYANLYANQVMRASTLKGLVIHTAAEAGPAAGPDYGYGWGLLDAAKAAGVITNADKNHLMLERSLAQGETYSFTVVASGNGPLMGTLSWTDPEATTVKL